MGESRAADPARGALPRPAARPPDARSVSRGPRAPSAAPAVNAGATSRPSSLWLRSWVSCCRILTCSRPCTPFPREQPRGGKRQPEWGARPVCPPLIARFAPGCRPLRPWLGDRPVRASPEAAGWSRAGVGGRGGSATPKLSDTEPWGPGEGGEEAAGQGHPTPALPPARSSSKPRTPGPPLPVTPHCAHPASLCRRRVISLSLPTASARASDEAQVTLRSPAPNLSPHGAPTAPRQTAASWLGTPCRGPQRPLRGSWVSAQRPPRGCPHTRPEPLPTF